MVKNNTRAIENAASDAVRAISEAASKATSVIAQAAESAAKVVSNKAEAEARTLDIPSQQKTADHDIIVKLDTKVDQIQLDVNLLKTQNSQSPTRAEYLEVVRVQADHETRTRALETFRDNLMGKMIAMGSLSGLVTGVIILVISHYWK